MIHQLAGVFSRKEARHAGLDRAARAMPWFLLILFASIIGCSFKQPSPIKQSFLVEARRNGEPRGAVAPAVLRVHNLRATTAFEGKGFVYRTSKLGCQTDFYHEFLVAPRLLITEQARQWLGASGLFRHVIDAGSKADATHSLGGTILELSGDFRDSASPKAVLAVEFLLTNDRPDSPAIILHKTYRHEVSLENRAPETLARGWGSALEQILGALESDLASALAK